GVLRLDRAARGEARAHSRVHGTTGERSSNPRSGDRGVASLAETGSGEGRQGHGEDRVDAVSSRVAVGGSGAANGRNETEDAGGSGAGRAAGGRATPYLT